MQDLSWRRRWGSCPAARRGAQQRAGLTPASASNTLSSLLEMLHSKQLRSIKMLVDSNHGIYRDPLESVVTNKLGVTCWCHVRGLGISLTCYRSPLYDRRRLSSRRFVARLGPLRPARIRLHVLFGCAVDQRQNFVLDRLDRRHGRVPLRSVPLD